jgi:hypothetical protein
MARVMVFNGTFNNISAISWWSALLVQETGVSGENHRPVGSHWQTYHKKCCIQYTWPWAGFELPTLVVVDTDCTGSCKWNYHTITTTTTPFYWHILPFVTDTLIYIWSRIFMYYFVGIISWYGINSVLNKRQEKNKGWWELSIQRYRQQDTEWRQKKQKQHKN